MRARNNLGVGNEPMAHRPGRQGAFLMNEPKTSTAEEFAMIAQHVAANCKPHDEPEFGPIFRIAMLQAWREAFDKASSIEWLTEPERFKLAKLRDSKKGEDF